MSLVDNGPDTVVIFPEETVTDWRGNIVKQPAATGVTVTGCWMQPVSSTRGAIAALKVDQGQDVSVAYNLITRSGPLGWWSRVEWIDETGTRRKFAVLGGPQNRRYSPATGHLSCTLQEMR